MNNATSIQTVHCLHEKQVILLIRFTDNPTQCRATKLTSIIDVLFQGNVTCCQWHQVRCIWFAKCYI